MVRHEILQLSIATWASQLLWCSQICRAEGLIVNHMGVCQNYGPCLGTLNFRCRITYYNRDPKRDHNFDNDPHGASNGK